MFGTLIGIFLTSAGIVVGADAVLWGSSAPGATRGEKTCTPSERSVAAFEGWYGEELYLYKQFHEKCRALARSTKPLSLEEQADRLIQTLQQKYRDRTGPFSAHAASLPAPVSKHVASVAAAGFVGTTPVVTVRELRWEKNRKDQWRLIVERVGKLSFQGCGAKFLGEDGIAALLLDTSPYFEQEKRRSDVCAASRANRLKKEDDCVSSVLTIDDAKTLYKTAVRMTIDHGEEFHIENGTVGGRLHLLTIPTAGSIEEELVDPEQYLE
ncbi:MAG: hypothetical protein ACHQWV_02095 [Nitrospirales bacterium]